MTMFTMKCTLIYMIFIYELHYIKLLKNNDFKASSIKMSKI